MEMNMLAHSGFAETMPASTNSGVNSDNTMYSAVAPVGQSIAQPMFYPVMVANTGAVGVPVMWPVSQVPQGAFVFAPNSNSFVNMTMQPNAVSFVPMEEYWQASGYEVSDSNRSVPSTTRELDDPIHSRRSRVGRPASMNADALTSEEIEEMRLAVQNTVLKLQNPSSQHSPHRQDVTGFAGASYPYKPQERDNDTLSSTSSTCAPDADDDSYSMIGRGTVKPRREHSISDKDVDSMNVELECSNSERRQKAIEWVISSTQLLAFSRRGCRIVQRSMELAVWEDQERLVEGLEGLVLEALQSPHANYVLQKCFEIMPPSKLQFVLSELKGQGSSVARHRFGCRVIQRILEHCPPDQSQELIAEVLAHTSQLARHTYGNFVIQHILQHGTSAQVHQIAVALLADVIRFANHRIASHVVSCALSCCSLDDVQSLTEVLLEEKDQLTDRHYGSFVVREANRISGRVHNVATN
jgi:hypothetical protein